MACGNKLESSGDTGPLPPEDYYSIEELSISATLLDTVSDVEHLCKFCYFMFLVEAKG